MAKRITIHYQTVAGKKCRQTAQSEREARAIVAKLKKSPGVRASSIRLGV